MTLRLTRVVAIARRELRQDLKGRQGLFVPGVLVALMAPVSLLPPINVPKVDRQQFVGEVPESLFELPTATRRPMRGAVWARVEGETLVLDGPSLLPENRAALDAARPGGRVELVDYNEEPRYPQRGSALALLSASSLTGSAAGSLGGERSRKTLTTLMAAAVSAGEIIVGKWLAWTTLGTGSTLVFAAVAVARSVDAGPWLLPMAATPAAMAAVALWAVRSSPDVVDATATALRVIPTVTMVTVLAAITLGTYSPLLGAAVPLGGALLTAGAYWEPAPFGLDACVGAASALVAAAGFLTWTAADLDDVAREPDRSVGWVAAPGAAAAASLALASPLVAPSLWTLAGNPFVTSTIPIDAPPVAAACALAAWMAVRAAQHDRPGPFLHLRRPTLAAWAAAAAAGLGLAALTPWFGFAAGPQTMLGTVASQFDRALVPMGFSPWAALLLIVAEELTFRAALGPRIGHGPASAAWAFAKAPFDPFAAIVAGTTLAAISQRAGFWGALSTRLIWWAAVSAAG